MSEETELGPEAEEEEENAQPAQEPAAEQAPPAEEAKPRKPTDEIKVVIVMKADKILIGVQSPDCDPIYKTLEGNMALALKKVPGLIKEANVQWDAHPRYPKANLPTPEPAPAPERTTARTRGQPASTAQPSFF